MLHNRTLLITSLCLFSIFPFVLKADWVTTDINVFSKYISREQRNKSDIIVSYNFIQVSKDVITQNLQFYQAQLFYDKDLKTVVNAFDFSVPIEKLLTYTHPTFEQISKFIEDGGCFFKVNGQNKITSGKKKTVFFHLQFNVYSTNQLFDSSVHKKCLLSMYSNRNFIFQQDISQEETKVLTKQDNIIIENTTKQENIPNMNQPETEMTSMSKDTNFEDLTDYNEFVSERLAVLSKTLVIVNSKIQNSSAAKIYYGGFAEYLRKFGNGRDFWIVAKEWDDKLLKKGGVATLDVPNHILGQKYSVYDYEVFSQQADALNLAKMPNGLTLMALINLRINLLNKLSKRVNDNRISAKNIDAFSKSLGIDILLYASMDYNMRMMLLKSRRITDKKIHRTLENFTSVWSGNFKNIATGDVPSLSADIMAGLVSHSFIQYVKNEL